MKTFRCLLAAALLLPGLGASAQAFIAADQPAGATHATAPAAPARCYSRSIVGGGTITYFAAAATTDAQHPQFAQLRHVFETVKPTVVYYENPDLGIDSTETATINRLGPAGYARYLAQEHEVPTARLDNPLLEYEYLRSRLDARQLKLYYLLRNTQRQRELTHATSRKQVVRIMQQLLANSAYFVPGTEHVIQNLAELEAAYQTYCPGQGKWTDVPAAWFSPSATPADTTSAPLLAITVMANEFRNGCVYRELAERAQPGERVLVVAAPGRVPADLLAPAAPLAQ